MTKIELPEILNIPPKLLPIVLNFDKYNYHFTEGGRAGGKSHSYAKILLYIAEQKKVRICCGREIQNSINESVKTLFDDQVQKFNLKKRKV